MVNTFPTEPTRSGAPRATTRVCLLDAERALAPNTLQRAAHAGYSISNYSAADEAFTSLVANGCDVFVIVQPPGEQDDSTAKLVSLLMTSERLASRQVPLVVLTGNASAGNIQALYAAGAKKVSVGLNSNQFEEVLKNVANGTSDIAAPQAAPEPLSVCLFDDSYAFGQQVKSNLEASGHQVDYFPSAEAARAAAIKKRYAVIMAGQNDAAGLEVSGFVLALRNSGDPHCRNVPVFVLSDIKSPAASATLAAAGTTLVLKKRVNDAFNNQIVQAVDALKARTQRPKAPQVARAPEPPQPAPPPPSAPARREQAEASPAMDIDLTFGGVESHPGAPVQSGKRVKAELPRPPPAAKSPPSFVQAARSGPPRRLPVAKILAVLVGIGVLGAIGFVTWHQFFEQVPVDVVTARKGSLSKTVNGGGRVVAKKQVDLTSAQSGLISSVKVGEGDFVTKGDLLAQLDDREAQVNLSQALARLQEVASDLKVRERALEPLREASRAGGISASMVEELAGGITATKAKRNVAEQELAAARVALERLKVTAPFDGVIMQSYAVEGGWSEPPGALFKLVDTGHLEISILIDPVEVRDVNMGQTVQLSSDAFPGREWQGSVTRLVPGDEETGKSGLVYVSLGGKAPAVRYGQAVDARVVTESSKDAVKLPFEAILKKDGQSVVAVVEDERITFKPVQVGIQALAEVQVVSGLEAGQEVVLVKTDLREGQRVRATRVQMGGEEDSADYPFREKYSDVAIYTSDDLRREYDNAMIVDVRSRLEYDVVHIGKAVNVPLSDDSFMSLLGVVRAKISDQPLVFYCNGHTCTKSYKAAQEAKSAGFNNVFAYDSGVFDWMSASRDRTRLLGVTPAPLDKMVSEDFFQSHLVDFDAFKRRAADNAALVMDVRDDLQKKTALNLPTLEVPMDELIVKLKNGEYKGKRLLIADAVGKQVRWLQYLLEDLGYKEYYFLRGGVDGVAG